MFSRVNFIDTFTSTATSVSQDKLFGLEDVWMGGLGDDKTTEPSAIQAYLGTDVFPFPTTGPRAGGYRSA